MSGRIILSRSGPVAEILIDRPDKHNAMTPSMAVELREICRVVERDDAIRTVVLAGAGNRAFCAGSDINALDEYPSVWHFRNRVDYATQIRNLSKPCVAALKGWVLGGGLELCLGADIRIAATSARFGAPEVTHGWVGAGGASQLLPRLIGYGRASLLLLGGEPIDAQTAKDWGLVEKLVSDGQELDRARKVAEQLARHTLVALQTVKSSIRCALSTPLEAGIRYENEAMAVAFALGNAETGRAKFKERKKG
ncbi:MAG: enoyl-CoA hydratase/isomerase family protein [Bradyrhizobiaceae bacterium]|nr:enoyl-CoA hydratase/isomerase family protein [Bradyrhizobiaceae bacterium]